ncbi:MAG TPA: AAA family ATPase, partial [Niallia sp.]|nr:AAA family ATPase [Niallia sp.]
MQIKKVVIYGYGKLENITIPIDSSIHVFFGENEAGKSTIMSFIHSILFGFPTKQHTELRYEPKQQAKYGGKLEVVFPDTGLAIIERVKGKASGDVTVLLEDGTRGQEDLLEKLLLEIDKGTFQSIFSFSLQGLQNVQQLKGEELGRYLFSTGAVGSDVLLKVENDLQKELDIRFKPSGKKPLLNEKLAILRDKYSELKKAEKESSQYEELLTLKAKLEKEIEEAEQELEQEEYEKRQLEDWIKIRPIVLEKNVIEKKLEEAEKVTFPQDGVHRWESIKEQLITIEAKIKHHDHKWTEIEKELSGITCNEELVKHENTILLAIEKLPVYEQFQQRKLKLQNQLEIVEGEIANLKDQLHLSIEEEFIIENSNTSIFMKEQCANAASKQRHLKEQKVELDNRLREEQTTLESMEETIKELKTRLLSNEERKKLEDLVSNENQAKWYKEKANLLEREMNQVTELLGKEKERAKHNTILLSTFSFICLLLAVISFFFHQWLVLFLGLSFCIVSTFLFVGGRNRANKEMKKQQKKMNLLHEERKSLLTSVERG